MARSKVTVIGACNVGATTAQRIAEAGLADLEAAAALVGEELEVAGPQQGVELGGEGALQPLWIEHTTRAILGGEVQLRR